MAVKEQEIYYGIYIFEMIKSTLIEINKVNVHFLK